MSSCLGAGPSPNSLIEPGLRVGEVRIGESREAVHSALGKPAAADAAMGGKLTEVWRTGLGSKANGRKGELEIFFQGPGAGGNQRKPAGYCLAIHVFHPGTTPRPIGSFDE
jgi:hypothetical protein